MINQTVYGVRCPSCGKSCYKDVVADWQTYQSELSGQQQPKPKSNEGNPVFIPAEAQEKKVDEIIPVNSTVSTSEQTPKQIPGEENN